MGFITGLVSISFRQLAPEEIIRRVKDAGLDAIEWGGDVHVPFGNENIANVVGAKTRGAGLLVSEYGSYYRLGASAPEMIDGVVASAKALGVNTVRIWAYNKSSEAVSPEEYERVIGDAKRICEKYPEITFCTECHNDTLTDDCNVHIKLIKNVDKSNFLTFWQPNQLKSFAYNRRSAELLAPYTHAVHVFSWDGEKKYPLIAHRDRWIKYLEVFANENRERNIYLMLEFMHDGNVESLSETTEYLREFVRTVSEKQRNFPNDAGENE